MKRRAFIHNTGLTVLAVSSYGFIDSVDGQYQGDCETTTDILGPFYRPDSPVRNNLLKDVHARNRIQLSGTVKHKDCITPIKNARIEIWHCDENGKYDNDSDEYHYRATVFSDEKGQYWFNTILPVPYDQGGGRIRPAHFHLMITAVGYHTLVTQLYFSGDNHIKNDRYASSSKAKNRILEISTLRDGSKKVMYDISMSDKLALEPASIEKLNGVYKNEVTNKKTSLTIKRNQLWMENPVFTEHFEYIGNNTFQYSSDQHSIKPTLHFEILPVRAIKLTLIYVDDNLITHSVISIKENDSLQ